MNQIENSTKKHPGGRPSKKSTINLEQMKKLYLAGFKDAQVADFFNVTEQTINNWKSDKEFFESLKDWKQQADSKVERSLYESACGYRTKAKKAVVVSDGQGAGSHVEMVEEEIAFAPNSTSIIFWLKNRQPEQWRDKQEIELKSYLHPHLAKHSDDELEKKAHDLADRIVRARAAACTN